MLQFASYSEFHMNLDITMLSCVLCYCASHGFLLVYNTNETVPGMPETKETFDWIALMGVQRLTGSCGDEYLTLLRVYILGMTVIPLSLSFRL